MEEWLNGMVLPSDLQYSQYKIKGLYWDGCYLKTRLTHRSTKDMLVKYDKCGIVPSNIADLETMCCPNGGHGDCRYLSDVCEAASIGRLKSCICYSPLGNIILDVGAKLNKRIIDKLLYNNDASRNHHVGSIIKIRPNESQYDKAHWASIEKTTGLVTPKRLHPISDGIYLFKGTLQEYSIEIEHKGNHHILMHDCIYYFN